jgi:hypothetical protein
MIDREKFPQTELLYKKEVDVLVVTSCPFVLGPHRSGKRCFPVDDVCAVWDQLTNVLSVGQ